MIAFRLISWFPFPLLYFLAWIGYLLLYYVAGYRKAVVKQNMARAFPEKSANEITVLAKRFYRHLAAMACEVIKARRMTADDFRRRVRLLNTEVLEKATENYSKSVIVLAIHQGNWEWMLHGATTALNIPIDPVYKPLHNETVDKLIFDIRSRFGSRPLPMDESTRDILRRRREFRIFVMVAEQSPTRHDRGYWTTFLNQDAAFFLGTEVIAKMTGFPVLFAQCHSHGRGHYDIEFHQLAEPPYDKKSHLITDRYVALTESAIKADPASWLWSNRRWKRDRAAEEAAAAGAANQDSE